MGRIILDAMHWIGRKLLLLLWILLILLVAAWVKGEWAEIARMLEQVQRVEREITRRTDRISALQEQANAMGEDARAAMEKLQSLEHVAATAEAAAARTKHELEEQSRQVGWWQYLFDQGKVAELAQSRAKHEAMQATAAAARAAANGFRQAGEHAPWKTVQREIESLRVELSQLEADKGQLADGASRTPGQRLVLAAWEQLPAALCLLLGVLLVPPGIRCVLYYVVAPMAARVPPISVLPEAAGQLSAGLSSVSQSVLIRAGEELLVRPDCLQSVGVHAAKTTRWFLNRRLPISSVAAGMGALTAVHPTGQEAESATLSTTGDPLAEILRVELPDGAALVLHPRAMAAVLKPIGHEVRITRHWRLASPHAWITLQFRYLVFHGPCEVFLKGRRGVRMESAESSGGRLINQAATMGFSANLGYSNHRCETFIAYLRGCEELFNDRFSGGPGYFLYEEAPGRGDRSIFAGRGLEGIADALLKAFGI